MPRSPNATKNQRQGAEPSGMLDGVPRNAVLLGIVSFLNDLSSEMIGNLVPIFLRTVFGTAMVGVGVIEGVVASASSLLKPASGWLSDHIGRRKPGILLGYWLAACTRPLMAVSAASWHVLGLRFADRVGKGVRAAPRDALLADSASPEHRGKVFGFQRALDNAGAAAGLLIAALVLGLAVGSGEKAMLRTLFLIASIPGIAVVALVIWGLKEPRDAGDRHAARKADVPLRSAFTAPLIKWYIVVFVFWLGNSSDGFLLYKAATTLSSGKSLKDILWQVPLLAFVMSLCTSLVSTHAGAFSDRLGRRRVLVAGWLLYAFVYVAFGFTASAWGLYLLFAVYGLYYALTEGVERALVTDLAPAQGRGTALGIYHFVAGAAALPASIICGWLWELEALGENGPRVALGFGAACAFLAAVLMLILNPQPPAEGAIEKAT